MTDLQKKLAIYCYPLGYCHSEWLDAELKILSAPHPATRLLTNKLLFDRFPLIEQISPDTKQEDIFFIRHWELLNQCPDLLGAAALFRKFSTIPQRLFTLSSWQRDFISFMQPGFFNICENVEHDTELNVYGSAILWCSASSLESNLKQRLSMLFPVSIFGEVKQLSKNLNEHYCWYYLKSALNYVKKNTS